MNCKDPIGVIDSGVGGLTVLPYLQRLMPHEDFLYLGDTARTPYGIRSRQEIATMVAEMTAWMEDNHIKQLVVACNTITVLGAPTIRGLHSFRVVGMSKGAKLALTATKNKKIGIFATDFTVSTQAHQKAILELDHTAQVFSQGCTKFVPLIEGEQFDTPELAAVVREYTDILKKDGVDTVLLSCTHYPFIKKEIVALFGPEITVIDPAEETAADALADLQQHKLDRKDGKGQVTICFTADLERGRRLASRVMDISQCRFKQVDLHSK